MELLSLRTNCKLVCDAACCMRIDEQQCTADAYAQVVSALQNNAGSSLFFHVS